MKAILHSLKEMPSWEKKALVAILCFFAAEYYLVNPMIPKLVEKMGIGKQTGWVTGAFFFGAILAIAVSRPLLDRFGSWVVSWATVCCAAIPIVCFYFVVVDFKSMLAVQLVRGLCYGVQMAAIEAMLTQMVPKEQRPKAIGRMYSMSTISLLIFSKLGIDLAEQDHYTWIWIIGIVLAVVSAGLFLSNRVPRVERPKRESLPHKQIIHMGVVPSGFAVMGVTLFCGVVFQYIQKYSVEEGLLGYAGYFTVVMAVSVLIFRHLVYDVFPEHRHLLVTVSIVLLMVSGCLLAVGGVFSYFLAATFVGVGFGICVPFFATCAYKDVPVLERGSAAATYTMLSNMGPMLGLMAGGFLGEIMGYRLMYLLIVPLLFATPGFWVVNQLRRLKTE